MPERIFFQCSLPRAGSTLLQNVLAQNPDFYATPTSGIIEIFLNARNIYTNNIEFKAQDVKVVEPAFKALCKGGMNAYFNSITDKKYVIDKSRGWSVTYDFVDWFYPDPKVVVMVRDLRSIVSSMEKKWRQHQHIDSGLQNWNELRNTTVDKRIDYYLEFYLIEINF
jgi:sulfotransferase